jgi:hypothetical protein
MWRLELTWVIGVRTRVLSCTTVQSITHGEPIRRGPQWPDEIPFVEKGTSTVAVIELGDIVRDVTEIRHPGRLELHNSDAVTSPPELEDSPIRAVVDG